MATPEEINQIPSSPGVKEISSPDQLFPLARTFFGTGTPQRYNGKGEYAVASRRDRIVSEYEERFGVKVDSRDIGAQFVNAVFARVAQVLIDAQPGKMQEEWPKWKAGLARFAEAFTPNTKAFIDGKTIEMLEKVLLAKDVRAAEAASTPVAPLEGEQEGVSGAVSSVIKQ